LPLTGLWPQLGTAVLCFGAVVWGAHRLAYEPAPAFAILVNMFWCIYHFCILTATLYFNHSEEPP